MYSSFVVYSTLKENNERVAENSRGKTSRVE